MLISLVSSVPIVGSFGLRFGGGEVARSPPSWQLRSGEYDEFIAFSVEAASAAEGRDLYATSYGASSSLASCSPSLQGDFLQSAIGSAELLCCNSSAHRGRRGGDVLEGTMRGGKPRGGKAHA